MRFKALFSTKAWTIQPAEVCANMGFYMTLQCCAGHLTSPYLSLTKVKEKKKGGECFGF